MPIRREARGLGPGELVSSPLKLPRSLALWGPHPTSQQTPKCPYESHHTYAFLIKNNQEGFSNHSRTWGFIYEEETIHQVLVIWAFLLPKAPVQGEKLTQPRAADSPGH